MLTGNPSRAGMVLRGGGTRRHVELAFVAHAADPLLLAPSDTAAAGPSRPPLTNHDQC